MPSDIMGKTYVRPEIRKFFKEYPFIGKYFIEELACSASAYVVTNPDFFSKDGWGWNDRLVLDKEGNCLVKIQNYKIPVPYVYTGKSKLYKFIISLLPQNYKYIYNDTLNDALDYLKETAVLAYMVLGRNDGDIYLYMAPDGMSFKEWGDKLLAESEKS